MIKIVFFQILIFILVKALDGSEVGWREQGVYEDKRYISWIGSYAGSTHIQTEYLTKKCYFLKFRGEQIVL